MQAATSTRTGEVRGLPLTKGSTLARVLVDITHPAHAHFFRHPIAALRERGHEIVVTSRRKEIATKLLDDFGLEHRLLDYRGRRWGMLGELISRDRALARMLRELRPACVTAVGGVFAAHAGALTRTPSVIFYDTENARLQNLLTYPLATTVAAPRCYEGWLPNSSVRYPGYHELSYLHPNRFRPSQEVAIANGLAAEGDTFLVRTVAWQANHDIGERGWSSSLLRTVVEHLAKRGTVLISAEATLPADLEVYRYPGDSAQIHHLMAFCRLHVGESATMASESAALGVPAIYAARTGRGYMREQDRRYGLVKWVCELAAPDMIAAIDEFGGLPPETAAARRQAMLEDCTEVAAFAADIIGHHAGDARAGTERSA
jgi:predicted glycosyltransferase